MQLTHNTRFAGDFEFFYALNANRARPHSLGLGLRIHTDDPPFHCQPPSLNRNWEAPVGMMGCWWPE